MENERGHPELLEVMKNDKLTVGAKAIWAYLYATDGGKDAETICDAVGISRHKFTADVAALKAADLVTTVHMKTEGRPAIIYGIPDLNCLIAKLLNCRKSQKGVENPVENSSSPPTTGDKEGGNIYIYNTLPYDNVNSNMVTLPLESYVYKDYNVSLNPQTPLKPDLNCKICNKVPEQEPEPEEEPEPVKRLPALPKQKIVDLFNGICISLPKCMGVSSTREQLLRTRWNEHPDIDFWENFFHKVQDSDFLTGRIKDFRAGFDWLIRPTNFQKILEGNYDNRPEQKKNEGSFAETSFDIDEFAELAMKRSFKNG